MLNGTSKIMWPQGKRFAFTIIDDTDRSNVENIGPVYDFLYENGFITTKTVWPLSPRGSPIGGGDSLGGSGLQGLDPGPQGQGV